MKKPILYYECKTCGTQIPPNTKGVYTKCKCGRMGIDGTSDYTRIKGHMENIEQLRETPPPIHVYRIRQLTTGLYFVPRRGSISAHFSKVGKFYGKRPNLGWVEPQHGECVIDKYLISKTWDF